MSSLLERAGSDVESPFIVEEVLDASPRWMLSATSGSREGSIVLLDVAPHIRGGKRGEGRR